jgi:hypothetical protein
MASQVVEYKLCDNKFDCDNCPFDKVIGNISDEKGTHFTEGTTIPKIIHNKLHGIKYDNRIIYLKNSLVAKEIFQNTFYLGINPILTCFLDSVNTVMHYERGKTILTGEDIIRVFGAWGTVSLSAPMNLSIYDKVNDPPDDSLNSKWFAVIGASQRDVSNGILCEEKWSEMHQRALGIIEGIKSCYPKVGDTMHDGGVQIKSLDQLVGKKRYINILNSLIT